MLQGTLKTFSLIGLLQMCAGESSTGLLKFFIKGDMCGAIGFQKGELFSAQFIDMSGIDAVRQIALLQELEFQYDMDADPGTRNIDTDVDFLIIDLTRYLDESTEYFSTLKSTFLETYPKATINLCSYDYPLLRELKDANIHYLEWVEGGDVHVIYLDRQINARIGIVFQDMLTTDYLLMALRDKGMM